MGRAHGGGRRGRGGRHGAPAPAVSEERGDAAALQDLLRRLDGRGYPAYRELRGRWRIDPSPQEPLELWVDHVQGDPYAAPSRVRLRLPTGLDRETTAAPASRVAAEDWLLRRFAAAVAAPRRRGSGRSGTIQVLRPGAEVLGRSAAVLHLSGLVELRISVGLPAAGRRILGREAAGLLLGDLAEAVAPLREADLEPELHRWVQSLRVQRQLRDGLAAAGLVAFVADGAVLPRESGVGSGPLPAAVPFESPPGLRVGLRTEAGTVEGMGLKAGVTVIAGGGYHGKSTLLHAIQTGHLDHVPGDGRERVVALADTVKVRAEDGRCVHSVDVSPFLGRLPGGRSTRPLSTADASGSTSQAAAVVEALQSGARLLLFDEDSCATNLMVRDPRMERLLAAVPPPGGGVPAEPIQPLLHHVRSLAEDHDVSSILVIGGVGDYLALADEVLVMSAFRAVRATEAARLVAGPPTAATGPFPALLGRELERASLRPTGKGRIRAREGGRVEHGEELLDLTAVDQVGSAPQCATLAHALRTLAARPGPAWLTVAALAEELDELLAAHGLDALSPFETPVGTLVEIRRHELAAALARLRTVRARPVETP